MANREPRCAATPGTACGLTAVPARTGVNRRAGAAPTALRRGRIVLIQRARGFTLIELVAAFVIFALGFGVLLQILSGALHTTAQSVDYSKAAMWAQSLLDIQGIGEPLQEGTSSGHFDDQYSWQLRVAKYDPPPVETAVPAIGSADAGGLLTPANPPLDLFQLELIVSWGNQYLMHRARFSTVRVMNPPLQAGNTIPPPIRSRQ